MDTRQLKVTTHLHQIMWSRSRFSQVQLHSSLWTGSWESGVGCVVSVSVVVITLIRIHSNH